MKIKKFNESVRDKMTPKSEEDIMSFRRKHTSDFLKKISDSIKIIEYAVAHFEDGSVEISIDDFHTEEDKTAFRNFIHFFNKENSDLIYQILDDIKLGISGEKPHIFGLSEEGIVIYDTNKINM